MSKIIKFCPICEEPLKKSSLFNRLIDLHCPKENEYHSFWIQINSKLSTYDPNKVIMLKITWNKFPKLLLTSNEKFIFLGKILNPSYIDLIKIPKFRISLNKDAIEDLFNKLIILHKFQ
jgi:hypothetical protein